MSPITLTSVANHKIETESGNGKAEIRKWSSQLFHDPSKSYLLCTYKLCDVRVFLNIYRELASTKAPKGEEGMQLGHLAKFKSRLKIVKSPVCIVQSRQLLLVINHCLV